MTSRLPFLAAILLVACPDFASASFIRARVNILGYQEVAAGSGSVTIGPVTTNFPTSTNTASAEGNADSEFMFRLSAETLGRVYDFNSAPGRAIASVGYRDIINLGGSESLPSTIRLTFEADGQLEIRPDAAGNYNGTVAAFGASLFGDYNNLDLLNDAVFQNPLVYARLGNSSQPGGTLETRGFGSWENSGSGFSGRFSVDITYNAALGGYAYNLVTIADAHSYVGTAKADFGSTVNLVGITRTDGGALDDFDISFASGMRFGPLAVPEPSSWILLGTGGTAVFVGRLRRRWLA